jgi:hypothetical protein
MAHQGGGRTHSNASFDNATEPTISFTLLTHQTHDYLHEWRNKRYESFGKDSIYQPQIEEERSKLIIVKGAHRRERAAAVSQHTN